MVFSRECCEFNSKSVSNFRKVKDLAEVKCFNLLIGRLAISTVCFALNGYFADASHADELLLKRCLQSYLGYQQVRLTGAVTKYIGGSEVERHEFIHNIGSAMPGQVPPHEILLMKPNPGEPHIDDAILVDSAWGAMNGVTFYFAREYVSNAPFAERYSLLHLTAASGGAGIGGSPFDVVGLSVHASFNGSDSRESWGNESLALSSSELDVLGKETYLGTDCLRVLFKILKSKGVDSFPPLEFECLLAVEPTIQVLKLVTVKGGPPGYVEMARNAYSYRNVVSAKTMGKWLICNKVQFDESSDGSRDDRWEVVIDDAVALPSDYNGLWEYNSLTGVLVSGNAEPSTRRGSQRVPYEFSKELMKVSYKPQEQQKIREFLMKSVAGVKPERSISRLSLLTVNLLALVALATFFLVQRRRRLSRET